MSVRSIRKIPEAGRQVLEARSAEFSGGEWGDALAVSDAAIRWHVKRRGLSLRRDPPRAHLTLEQHAERQRNVAAIARAVAEEMARCPEVRPPRHQLVSPGVQACHRQGSVIAEAPCITRLLLDLTSRSIKTLEATP